MTSRLLLEKQRRSEFWRIVDRQCTRTGFDPYVYYCLAENCRPEMAREIYGEMKHGRQPTNARGIQLQPR